MKHACLSLIAAVAVNTAAIAEDDWYPSKYGADDTKGAMNNLSPEATVKAAKLVKTGKVYALGVVTGPETPSWPGRSFSATVLQTNDGAGGSIGTGKATGHDDILMTYIGIGTQIDGFAHLGIDHRYYNGVSAREFYRSDGVIKFGTENILPTATRGVLLDMTKHYKQTPVKPGTAFTKADIDTAAKAAGVTIGKGDVVVFHTGWMAMAANEPKKFINERPGV